jgi:protein-histidine pros-kinase
VFTLAGIAAGRICDALIEANARQQVLGTATLMLDSALASREYTAQQIDPLLVAQMQQKFLPQSIPFYAATQTFDALRKLHPSFTYKEATLNPTDPSDRASDWEADVIDQFRNHPGLKQIQGERMTPMGRSLYLARPIRALTGCLDCHGRPEAAPATLIARYGRQNGFGWQPNDIMAAQIVSVPFADTEKAASRTFAGLMTLIAAMLAALLVVADAALYLLVLRPLKRLTLRIDEVSLGRGAGESFDDGGGGELGALGESFERMRKSLEKALKLIGGDSHGA